jgi:hypothetical protein
LYFGRGGGGKGYLFSGSRDFRIMGTGKRIRTRFVEIFRMPMVRR